MKLSIVVERDFPRMVIMEKSSQHILFSVRSELLHHIRRVITREKNVVDVHMNSRFQSWEDPQIFVDDISVGLDNM